MKKNPDYDAGFLRAREDELPPEEQLAADARAARNRRLRIGAIGLTITAVIAAGVYEWRRDTPEKQLARAKAYIAKDQHRSAVLELKHSLQEYAQQPEARFLLGQQLTIVGDVKGASIEFQKALDGGLPAEQVITALVNSRLKDGEYEEVVTLVNHASVESPEINADLQTMLGTAYLALKKYEAGESAFAAAKELVPHHSGALIAEAKNLMTQERYDEARASLAKVDANDKRQDELQALEGDIAKVQHRTQDAVTAYEKAVRLDPKNMTTRFNLSQAYVENKDLDKAKATIDVVVKNIPDSGRVQFAAAAIAFLRKDIPAARDAIIQAVQLTPNDAGVQLLAGVIDLQVNDQVNAELHLRQAIQIVPDMVQARQSLAELYLLRNEPQKAEEIFRPVIGARPQEREVATLAARIATAQGNFARASQLFDRIGILQSNDVPASIVSASLRFAAGNAPAGFEQLKAAAKASPDDTAIDVAIITHALQLRQVGTAASAWRVLQAREPRNARTYGLAALIDQARNDPAASRRSLAKALELDAEYFPAIAGLAALDLEERKVDDVRRALRRFADTAKHPGEALLMLARVEGSNGAERATVERLLKEAQKSDPKSEHVADDLIAFYAAHGDPVNQLAAAQQGLTFAPNNQYYLVTSGDLLMQAGQLDRALAAFTRLNALNDEYPEFPVKLGNAQLATNQTERAMTTFRNVVKRNPKRVDLHVRSVAAFLDTGRSDEASRMLFEVSQVAPDSPILVEYDADIKVAMKRFPEAVAVYKKAMVSQPNSKLAIKMARALDLSKQKIEANLVLADWLKTHPKDELVMAFDAQRALTNKEYERAAAQYRKLVDAHPKNAVLVNNYAWALHQKKDPQAVVYAEQAVALAPDDPDAADTLGTVLTQRGDAKRGLQLIEKAAARAPTRLEIKLHLAKAQIGNGQASAARETLQAVIAAAPESVEGKESRALLTTL